MKLKIKLGVSENTQTSRIILEDYGITDKEWKLLSDAEKQEKIQDIVDNFDQPYWIAENFEEI